ncbi:tetratricopeptide repeat protein [candidate division KSB1 bacterium]
MKKRIVCSLFLISICFGLYSIQDFLDKEIEKKKEIEFHYLPNGMVLKSALKGFSQFAADVYWIKSVLYFGRNGFDEDYTLKIPELFSEAKEYAEPVGLEEKREKLELLEPFIDLVITLDPYFYYPYLFGGLLLSMKTGKFEKSIEILRRGEKVFPDDWRIPIWIGFNYFFYLGDTESALIEFLKSAGKEDCPAYVARLAAGVAKKSGKKELAVIFLQGARDSAQSELEEDQINNLLNKINE